MKQIVLLLILLPLVGNTQPNKRLQPGKMYEPGEVLFAPRLGLTAKVPQGWTGVLPRDAEIFLLTSQRSSAEIFVLVNDDTNLSNLMQSWEKGFDIANQIRLKSSGASIREETLSAEVIAVGPFINKGMRGYAAARCSIHGPCVTTLAIMPAQQYDDVKADVDVFMSGTTFEAPSLASAYADLSWKDFLAGQMVTTYAFLEQGSKETMVHLCRNGTFHAKVTKKGILKNQNPAYKGKLTGTWSADGVGEHGLLHLAFDKELPPLDIELTMKEEKFYAGSDRYFIAVSDQCK